MKVTINTNTSGKFRKERINGRDHIVTRMLSIEGDSVMNRGFYPDAAVNASFDQLDMLPAPNDHPNVAGQDTSAFHPCAINAHNIGAFTRNPKKDGKKVINELWVDEEVANNSEDGRELIHRIETGKSVAVSTGMFCEKLQTNGQYNGKDYDWVANKIRFDHVAVLLNKKPAGENTFLLNEDGEGEQDDILVVNNLVKVENEFSVQSTKEQLFTLLNEDSDEFVFIVDCIVTDGDSGDVIYEKNAGLFKRQFSVSENGTVSLSGLGVTKVRRQVEFIELESGDAAHNSHQQIEEETQMPDDNDDKVTVNSDLTVENAMKFLEGKGMVVVNKEKAEQIDTLIANQGKIDAMLANEDARLNGMREAIVANSEMSDEDVADMKEETLTNLYTSFVPHNPINNQLRNGNFIDTNSQSEGEEDHLPTYAPTYAEAS